MIYYTTNSTPLNGVTNLQLPNLQNGYFNINSARSGSLNHTPSPSHSENKKSRNVSEEPASKTLKLEPPAIASSGLVLEDSDVEEISGIKCGIFLVIKKTIMQQLYY